MDAKKKKGGDEEEDSDTIEAELGEAVEDEDEEDEPAVDWTAEEKEY